MSLDTNPKNKNAFASLKQSLNVGKETPSKKEESLFSLASGFKPKQKSLRVINIPYVFILFCWITVAYLQYVHWFGPSGYYAHQKISASVENQKQRNESIKDSNRVLEAYVEEIKVGKGVEEKARTDLGMIRKGETFIQVNLTK